MRHTFLALTVVSILAAAHSHGQPRDDLRIWREFLQLVHSGRLSAVAIRPHAELGEAYREVLRGYLDSVRTQASPEDWDAEPEIIRTGERIQVIVPWSARGHKLSYCFSFVTEGSRWWFEHLETIFVRLDKISRLPTAEFPDVSEAQKSWAREEIFWSFVITNIYLPAAKEHGLQYALDQLKDGAGYVLGAKTWVPFAPPHKAFVLYLCWEQAKLRGNNVTLVALSDTEAVVELETHYFALYFTAAHLKPQISLDDYRRIFETIWQDRAVNAGWTLEVLFTDKDGVTFRLRRPG